MSLLTGHTWEGGIVTSPSVQVLNSAMSEGLIWPTHTTYDLMVLAMACSTCGYVHLA